MASAICTVNAQSTTSKVTVVHSTSVTIQLNDFTGVNSWQIFCHGTDLFNNKDAITASLVINQLAKTAIFTMPDGYKGANTLIFTSIVVDYNGQTTTSTFMVDSLDNNQNSLPALGETVERGPTGWLPVLTSAVSGSGSSVGVVDVTNMGADPTNTRDSTQAIQSAIDFASANGKKTIFFPYGNYKLTDTLKITTPGIKLLGEQNMSGGYSYTALRWAGQPYFSGASALMNISTVARPNGKYNGTVSGLTNVDHTWIGKRLFLGNTKNTVSGTGKLEFGGDNAEANFIYLTHLSKPVRTQDIYAPLTVTGSSIPGNNSTHYADPLPNSYTQRGPFRICHISQTFNDPSPTRGYIGFINQFGVPTGETVNYSYERDSNQWMTVIDWINATTCVVEVELEYDDASAQAGYWINGVWANDGYVNPNWVAQACTWRLDKAMVQLTAPEINVESLTLFPDGSNHYASSCLEVGHSDTSPLGTIMVNCSKVSLYGLTNGDYLNPQVCSGIRYGRPLNYGGDNITVASVGGGNAILTGLTSGIEQGFGNGSYFIRLQNASHSANNGRFLVNGWLSDTSIQIANPSAVALDSGISGGGLFDPSGQDGMYNNQCIIFNFAIGVLNESYTGQGKNHIYNQCQMAFCKTGIYYNSGNFSYCFGQTGHNDTAFTQYVPGDPCVFEMNDYEGNCRMYKGHGGYTNSVTFIGGRLDLSECSHYPYYIEYSHTGPLNLMGFQLQISPDGKTGLPSPMGPKILATNSEAQPTVVNVIGCTFQGYDIAKPFVDETSTPNYGDVGLQQRINLQNCQWNNRLTAISTPLGDDFVNGEVSITGTATQIAVSLPYSIYSNYNIQLTVSDITASGVVGVPYISGKTISGFNINVSVAPGLTKTIKIIWKLIKY